MPDPAAIEGSDSEKQRAFDDTLLIISRRLDLFLALPIEKLSNSPWSIGSKPSDRWAR
jgi:arsenate reductase